MNIETDDVTSGFPSLNVADIDRYFVKTAYRDGQKSAIEFVINAFNNDKRIVILECPTGSGKSAIGMTLANMVRDSYYLTITKILQDQLTDDFKDIVDLKGRNAYPCTFYFRHGARLAEKLVISKKVLEKHLDKPPDCSTGFCKSRQNITEEKKKSKNSCSWCFLSTSPDIKNYKSSVKIPAGLLDILPAGMEYCACPYYEQVYQAIDSRKVVMNFSSFLYQTSMTNRFDVPRDLLIIDEGHNIEPQILDFISLSINDSMLQEYNIHLPLFNTATEYAQWFKQVNIEALLERLIDKYEFENKLKEADEIEKLVVKIQIFDQNLTKAGSEWVVENNIVQEKNKTYKSVILKPVFATDFVEELLFRYGKRIVIMSATILNVNVICRSLGINKSEVAAYRMKNRFPVENRPIFYHPVARCTGGKDKMKEWMPSIISKVDEIAEKYPNVRGIIHTHNFAILDELLNKCKSSVARRFVTQREYPNKYDLLREHANRKNSIIVAPAMHEGIDLKDDLSRFQIICKIPYANFYDNKQLKRRIENDQEYYTWLTAIKIIQSYGRSIRSDTDYADTYILDEAFSKFSKDAKGMLPSWFTEALHS